ncbi:MAG: TPM domain-containing protein, partial [Bacteroidia bacterium]
DLLGNDASQYAFEIGNKWGVGSKNFNNGVVILIKPTGGAGERDLFIATGYGLEGAIPDLATKQIRENEMVPFLKEGQNYQALINAINAIEKAAKGEYNIEVKKKRKVSAKTIFIIIAIIIFIIWVSKQPPRGGSYSRGGWHGGYGRSFGGSSSSGGFGGFGGGSFGGGGSGGKW